MTGDDTEHKLEIRNLRSGDDPEVASIMERVYPAMGGAGTAGEYERLYNASYLCRRDGTFELQRKLRVTPSDFAFPHDAIASEATPNTEMVLVTDLDLDLLEQVRKRGSVRNLEGRRRDLYEVVWLGDEP